ncbi:Hypothetical protein SCF082_LOCUS6233 [Durusdinium trenchii]|uniref:Uncharacterized protein n=3 Tax=Durusdinium trenchii TaxID=1381693 RepID=A0ABP0IB69_9DINO
MAAVLKKDLDAKEETRSDCEWRQKIQELHRHIDEVVHAFISDQTRELDAASAELSQRMDRIVVQEKRLDDLSHSISRFVEAETKHLAEIGHHMPSDREQKAEDSLMKGEEDPTVLQRIERLWQKATKTFELAKVAKEQEHAAALEEQRRCLLEQASQVELENQHQLSKRDVEIKSLREELEALRKEDVQKEDGKAVLVQEVQVLQEALSNSRKESELMATQLEQLQAAHNRLDYQWNAEREELLRTRDAAQSRLTSLQRSLDEAMTRSDDLEMTCIQRGEKLEQMRTMMDEQELEMSQKIERVQQYVKERQASALAAEKKQQDAEKMAERWQNEVRRCQAEKERLSSLVMELEGRHTGQTEQWQSVVERHRREVNALEDALRKQEFEMKEANTELLSKRDEEHHAKVVLEKQREKERSIALLKKKEQEVHIKDQQLRAAKQRVQELESGLQATPTGGGPSGLEPREARGETSLPPLLSAR